MSRILKALKDPRGFAIPVFINISTGILGIYALCNTPTLIFDSGSSFPLDNVIQGIKDIRLDPSFFNRLPEFFFAGEEARWWRLHDQIYRILAENRPVTIEFADRAGNIQRINGKVGYQTFIEVIKNTGLIYLSGLIYIISAITVFRKHRSESGLVLSYFLIFGGLYLISSAPIVSRSITLIPFYFRLLADLDYIAAGGLITLVHFAFLFPRPKEIVKRHPYLPYIFFYGYAFLTAILYLSGITAFASTFPFLCLWIIIMLGAFIHSLLKERDSFLKKQITLSLLAPLMAGIVFMLLHLLPGILGGTSMPFTYFALFSLVLPFALPSAMENLRLYEEKVGIERDFQKEKERIRQELHDDLANDLTNIRFLSEVVEQFLANESERVRDSIKTIKETAVKNIGQIRDFIWAIDLEDDSTDDLLTQIKSYGVRLCKSLDIDIEFRGDASSRSMPLNTNLRFNLFNVFKEAMTNILKHSGSKKVIVELSINERGLKMLIADDGVGFDTKMTRKGSYGLKNMKKRTEEMGGMLDISSVRGKGTEISIILPQKYLN